MLILTSILTNWINIMDWLTASEALMILDAQRDLRLDGEAIDALAACVEAGKSLAP